MKRARSTGGWLGWGLLLAAPLTAEAAESPPESFGLVAHWPFDRSPASSVNPALYDGTPHGGARVTIDRTPGAAKVGEGALRVNSGLRTGDPAYVAIAQPPAGLAGDAVLTLTAWFKLSDVGGDGIDARNFVWESVPNSALTFSLNTTQRRKVAQFRFRSENYRLFAETEGPVMTPDTWHHVATVWNSRARHVRVYLNGRLHRELPLADADRLEPIRGLNLGGNKLGDGVADWDGWLDDVAIYDVELTAKQVAALHRGEATAATVLAQVPEPATQTFAAVPRALPPPLVPAHETTSQGPLLGHVDDRSAVLWARVPHPGEYRATATASDGHVVHATAVADAERDWCLHWRLEDLRPGTRYRVEFAGPPAAGGALTALTLRTPAPPAAPAKVVLGFGSCAEFSPNPVWTRIADECPDGMVLLGDTPYIDTTRLDAMRWAYRRFASHRELAGAFQRIPFWGTWDDHDFGRNDSDGTMPNKEVARRAFAEYRPLPATGEHGVATYSRFRRGPVEVFLLDTRWFARTERSWADPAKPGLLGQQQWTWLQRELRASTAPFKVLASGMIWDEKGGSTETDAWGSYPHERDALFRWLGEQRITGVVLVGGDVHVSRLVRFPTRGTTGYDLFEFVTSPLHDRVFPQARSQRPEVVATAEKPWVFLKLTADSTTAVPTLKGELMDRDGNIFFQRAFSAADLAPARE